MRIKRGQAGFSLLELIIAISLASLVLVAVTNLAASAVRFQMDGIRKGSVTGWSLVSFVTMSKEVENANVLVWPTGSADTIILCNNWSRLMAAAPGARLDTTQPLEVIYYCYNPATKALWRYYTAAAGTCPASVAGSVPACTGAAGFPDMQQIAWNVERLSGQNVFMRDDTIGGARIRYVVGQQTADVKHPITIYTPFDVGLSMQKQYSDTSD